MSEQTAIIKEIAEDVYKTLGSAFQFLFAIGDHVIRIPIRMELTRFPPHNCLAQSQTMSENWFSR